MPQNPTPATAGATNPTTPMPNEGAIRSQVRRVLASADGFDFGSLESHDYQQHAEAVLDMIRPLVLELGQLRAQVSQLSDDVTGACLAQYEEELDNERLRLALKAAKRGRTKERDRINTVVADRDAQIIAWLAKKGREEGTKNRDSRTRGEFAFRLADKLSRGAVRPPLSGEVQQLRNRVTELEAQAEKAAEFVAQRAEYVTSLRNCHPDNSHDYNRWTGHAEARRQLAQALGLPVAWPAEDNPPPIPLAYGPAGVPCGCGKDAHSNLVPCATDSAEATS